jgi:hypothetical protein
MNKIMITGFAAAMGMVGSFATAHANTINNMMPATPLTANINVPSDLPFQIARLNSEVQSLYDQIQTLQSQSPVQHDNGAQTAAAVSQEVTVGG